MTKEAEELLEKREGDQLQKETLTAMANELERIMQSKQLKPVPAAEVKLNASLPEGMRSVLWQPVGDYGWECRVEGFGVVGTGISKHKGKALGFALREMAELVLAAARSET